MGVDDVNLGAAVRARVAQEGRHGLLVLRHLAGRVLGRHAGAAQKTRTKKKEGRRGGKNIKRRRQKENGRRKKERKGKERNDKRESKHSKKAEKSL